MALCKYGPDGDCGRKTCLGDGPTVSFCLAVEIVKALVPRDVARKIFLRVLYLVEFPRHLFVFAKAVVIPGLLCLGATLLGVIESVLCALGLRVPQVCLPGKKGTLVCAFARHSSLLPPPRVAGLALGTPSGIKQLIRLVPIARRHQLTRGPRQEALRPCRDNGLRESPDAQGADECPTRITVRPDGPNRSHRQSLVCDRGADAGTPFEP